MHIKEGREVGRDIVIDDEAVGQAEDKVGRGGDDLTCVRSNSFG